MLMFALHPFYIMIHINFYSVIYTLTEYLVYLLSTELDQMYFFFFSQSPEIKQMYFFKKTAALLNVVKQPSSFGNLRPKDC